MLVWGKVWHTYKIIRQFPSKNWKALTVNELLKEINISGNSEKNWMGQWGVQ